MKNLLLHIFAASLMFIGVDARAEYLGDLTVESGDVYELLLDEVGDYVELDMLVVEEGAELVIDNGVTVYVAGDVEVYGMISGQDGSIECEGNLIGGGSVTISDINFLVKNVEIECNLEVQSKFATSRSQTLVSIADGYLVKAESMDLKSGSLVEGLIYLKAGKGVVFNTPSGDVAVTSTGDDGAYLAVKYAGSKPSQTSSTDAVNNVVYMSLDKSYYTIMALDGDVNITAISLPLDEGHSDLFSIDDKSSQVSSLYYSTNKWNEFSSIKATNGRTTEATCSLSLSDGESSDISYGIRKDFIEDVINNEASGSTITAVRIDSKIPGKYTWTGKKGTSFKDNNNWYGGYAPESSVDVVINSEYSEAAISAIFTISGAEEAARPNGSASGAFIVKNFPVISSGSVTVKSLTLNGLSTITIDGGALRVTNKLTVQNSGEEGHVIINNRASSSSALKYGSTNYSKFVVNRYFPQGKSYYVGSATTNGSVEGLGSDDMIAVYSGDDFGVTTSFNGSIIGGGIQLNSTDHIKQVGSLFKGNQSASGSSKKEGWMLFQNPFMSAVSASLSSFTFGNGLAKSLVFPTEGGFTTKNLGSGVTVLDNLKYGADGRSSIAPQQAFYVLTIDPEQGTSFTIREPSSPSAGVSLKSTRVETDVLRLTLGSESSFDESFMLYIGVGIKSSKNEALEKFSTNELMAIKDGIYNRILSNVYTSNVLDEYTLSQMRVEKNKIYNVLFFKEDEAKKEAFLKFAQNENNEVEDEEFYTMVLPAFSQESLIDSLEFFTKDSNDNTYIYKLREYLIHYKDTDKLKGFDINEYDF
ncbi:MAG: hypothetical protein MJZ15_06700, partial [Bacteroidales bacterium]|nr:hypothetical protein [Bacteroidales bacterium]